MTGEPAEASAPAADAASTPAAAPVFGSLVGQETVVAQLSAAAAGAASASSAQTTLAMTHAWLFTGPPGSGRSVAARAFAAALLCANQGCGQCPSCLQVAAGSHADLLLVRPDGLSYGVRQTRSLVLRAAAAPVSGRWRVVLFEDADRCTEQAAGHCTHCDPGAGSRATDDLHAVVGRDIRRAGIESGLLRGPV